MLQISAALRQMVQDDGPAAHPALIYKPKVCM